MGHHPQRGAAATLQCEEEFGKVFASAASRAGVVVGGLRLRARAGRGGERGGGGGGFCNLLFLSRSPSSGFYGFGFCLVFAHGAFKLFGEIQL